MLVTIILVVALFAYFQENQKSSRVNLTGKFEFPFCNGPIIVSPVNFTFTDTSTGAIYLSNFSFVAREGYYSVSVESQHTYKVISSLRAEQLSPSPIGPAITYGIVDYGTITIVPQVGNSSIVHDFIDYKEK
jgi:hypothetical protein